MTAKGSRHTFGMAKARVRSVPTGVCMSTPLRTGAALDMRCILMLGERLLLARPRDARALGGALCCEHVLSAKGSIGRRLGGAKLSMPSVSVRVWVLDAPLTTRVTLNI